MDNVLSYLTFRRRQFHQMSMRTRVVLSQAPLSVTTAALAVITVVFHPGVWSNGAFQWGMILSAALLLLCAAVPWDRLPYGWFLVIPLLDFVPVGLLRLGAGTDLLGVGLLSVFPVVWMCASGLHPRFCVAMGFFGPLMMIWGPLFLSGAGHSHPDFTRSLLLPIVIFGIGATVRVMTASMMDQQRALEEKDRALQELLRLSGQRERLLNATVNTVDVGLLAVDADGHDVLFNRRQREIHRIGLPKGLEDGPEKDLLIFGPDGVTPLPPEDRPAFRAVRGGTFTGYLVRVGARPEQRTLSVSARMMLDEAGQREGAVLAFNDVTELFEALNAKEEFVAMVSHELRTPLTVVVGYLDLLGEEDLPPSAAEMLTLIGRNVTRLQRLIDDLLTAASGTPGVTPVRADLAETAQEAVAAMSGRDKQAGVDIINEVPNGMVGQFDPVRIGQVLDNLLSNALKYSPDGGTVTIRARRTPASIVCEVADTGMGMSKAESAEVFSKFFRASSVRRTAIPGVGLGLAIVRSIIEEHGGGIRCSSEPGRGTTLTFELPDNPPGEQPAAGKSTSDVTQ